MEANHAIQKGMAPRLFPTTEEKPPPVTNPFLSSMMTGEREKIIPVLRELPFINIWHAGCATGEKVYSMAILLKEEGLYERARLYATDFNEEVIQKAREGIFAADRIEQYRENYRLLGGNASFDDYYTSGYDYAIMDQSLKKNIVFSDHNLVTDTVFGEMDLIMCRNVLIYFTGELQNHVIGTFVESLCSEGFLCLGSKEALRFSGWSERFERMTDRDKIYRKR